MPNLKWQVNVLVQQLEKLNSANGSDAGLGLLSVAAAVPAAAQVADRTFLDQPFSGVHS